MPTCTHKRGKGFVRLRTRTIVDRPSISREQIMKKLITFGHGLIQEIVANETIGSSGVDQLLQIINVIGTPSKLDIKEMVLFLLSIPIHLNKLAKTDSKTQCSRSAFRPLALAQLSPLTRWCRHFHFYRKCLTDK